MRIDWFKYFKIGIRIILLPVVIVCAVLPWESIMGLIGVMCLLVGFVNWLGDGDCEAFEFGLMFIFAPIPMLYYWIVDPKKMFN